MKIGPKYKIGRRLGAQVFDKTQSAKFKQKQANRENSRGSKRPRALSDFGLQLLEKQKVRFSYGITERQFRRYIKETLSVKGTKQDQILYGILESRLDNVIYRLGLSPTRFAGRQMISHGHINVNGSRVSIPSYAVKKGDIIGIRAQSMKSPLFQNLEEKVKDRPTFVWLSFDPKDKTGKIITTPTYEAGKEFFDLSSVLDFYKR